MAALPLLLTACLELEETVHIRADGSGTQRVRVGMTDRGQQIVDAFDPEADTTTAGAADRALDVGLVRRQLGSAGMRCRALRGYQEGALRSVDVAVEFADLDELRRSPLAGGVAEWRIERGPRPQTIRLVLFPRGERAWRRGFVEARRIGDEPTAADREAFERAKAEMDGLVLHWTLELPGEVLGHSRNLRRVDAKRVEAIVTSADIGSPRDLVRQLAPRYEVVFDGRGCSFALDGPPTDEGG